MTRYDPFAYGQVPLNQKEQPTAPDDMLFADAGPVKQAPAKDSDWGPPPGDTFSSTFRTGDTSEDTLAFGKDILGESLPDVAARPAPGKATPGVSKPHAATAPRAAAAAPASPPPKLAAPATAAGKGQATPATNRTPQRRGPTPVLMPRHTTTAAVVVPLAVLGVGGATAAWLHLMQQNPVMAGIVAVTTVVGSALAWVMSR